MVKPDDTSSVLLLFHAAAEGDRAAQEAFLRALHPALTRFALSRAQGLPAAADLAEDIAQEAMIRIACNLHQSRASSEGQLFAWALSITRRVLLDHLRAQPLPGAVVRLEFTELSQESSLVVPGIDPWNDPLRSDSPLTRLVHEVCHSLPAESRLLLRLRVETGAQWAHIAAELRTTPDGARRRFQRLQSTLRRLLLRRIDSLSPDARDRSRRRLGLGPH